MEAINNHKLRRVSKLILLAGALISGGCIKQEEEKQFNSNQDVYESLGFRDVLTDVDYDGKIDVLDRSEHGKPRKLFFKEGYGPSQGTDGIEYGVVDAAFFEQYDKAYLKRIASFYYKNPSRD